MRFAIYFTPPADDPLTRAAGEWLGRDAFSAREAELQPVPGLNPAERRELVRDPCRYGFHATLKAPFALATGRSEDELLAALREFAASRPPFDIPEIVIGQLGPFFALVPAGHDAALQDFAAAVVERFEPFRAPLEEADIARRTPEKLDPAQRENLLRWGYPYVFDEFRFHMTLTGPVPEARQEIVRRHLEAGFARFVRRPLAISHLAVFVEKERGGPFAVRDLLPLGRK